MSAFWGQLSNTMEQELACYKALQRFSEEEQQNLVAENIEALERIISQIEALVIHIRDIEIDRTRLIEEFMTGLGIVPSTEEFRRLVDAAEEPEAAAYRTNREALQEVVQTIGDLNRTNSLLIRNSLSFIDETMQSITGVAAEYSSYDEEGDRPVPNERAFHLLDRVL